MVLVQRDAVNYEMCSLDVENPGPAQSQPLRIYGAWRSLITQIPGNSPLGLSTSYYDFGYNLFVDRWNCCLQLDAVVKRGHVRSWG